MEETLGAQFALQVALQTLKERCQQYQKRLSSIEEENVMLRLKCNQSIQTTDSSLSEIDSLKKQVTQLSEQKSHLMNNIFMVTTENRHLWTRLSKLTQANQTLGSQLNRINDTLTQHKVISSSTSAKLVHSPLIRSKTFTQEEPQIRIHQKNVMDESEKISLELEDISLKLISNIAREKSELELQCTQLAELQNNDRILMNSFGFSYPTSDSIEHMAIEDFEQHIIELHNIKDILLLEKQTMEKNLTNLMMIHGKNTCKVCEELQEKVTESKGTMTSVKLDEKIESDEKDLESLLKWGTPENSNTFLDNKTLSNSSKHTQLEKTLDIEPDRICPMCSKVFCSNTIFNEFQHHVENHFTIDNTSSFEMV